MNYQQTVDWLFSQLPMYQNQGKAAYKADIGNIVEACKKLDQPQLKFPSVHIAGTNGKGSSSHMLASILQNAGYKVGLYTSPHLKDFRERIRVNGQMISQTDVIAFVSQNKSLFSDLEASFFEMTVAMSFDYFAKQKVDIAIIETGLGGRLDSTNIINPLVSVITNISMDHSNLLGNTIEEIAKEKAGIIKNNTPVIIGRKQEEIHSIFEKISSTNNAELTLAKSYSYNCDLKGNYQKENINTSVETIIQLKKLDWNVSEKNIILGLKNVVANTQLQGRWQILKSDPLVICDTGHNIEGIKQIVDQLKSINYQKLHFVIGFVEDKNIEDILDLLPTERVDYYFCQPKIQRALKIEKLTSIAKKKGITGLIFKNVKQAYEQAINNADTKDLVFIGGSTFVVAEIL
ncbi:MAG: folylpolyglutamate synthase/dihydrofolate synthase family protein [Flavobacteriales bacterium]